MKIYIFDINGTLTKIDSGLAKEAGYSTHAYWDLLAFHFVENKKVLKNEIAEWRPHVKILSEQDLKDDFIISSADMMQRALRHTAKNLSE